MSSMTFTTGSYFWTSVQTLEEKVEMNKEILNGFSASLDGDIEGVRLVDNLSSVLSLSGCERGCRLCCEPSTLDLSV